LSLRFLLDEDMSQRVAEGLRARGVDAVSVHEVGRGNRRISDAEQLQYASEQGRVFVTYNRADFQALDARWRSQGSRHGGILWCVERSIPRRATPISESDRVGFTPEVRRWDGGRWRMRWTSTSGVG